MNICIDCGTEYHYDRSNPLGSSSIRCSKCRKKDTKLKKKLRLYEIAGSKCLKCGYSRSIHALKLMDAIEPLHPSRTQEELEQQAKQQFPICLNCLAEIQNREVEMKVTSRSPIKVEFYLTEVQVIKSKLETVSISQDVIQVEVTQNEPTEFRHAKSTSRKLS